MTNGGKVYYGSKTAAAAIVAAYVIIIVSPVILATIIEPETDENLPNVIALHLGLLACGILAMQPLLAARLRPVTRHFGLDMVYRFHVAMGLFAALLMVLHPVLLSVGRSSWWLLTSLSMPWYLWLGKASIGLAVILAVSALWRAAIRLEYQKWLKIHNILAAAVLLTGFVHGWVVGPDLEHGAMKVLWAALLCIAGGAYAYNLVIGPLIRRAHAYRVGGVRAETHNVWTLEFVPGDGKATYDYLPGQFHFVTLHRRNGMPDQRHPFTISSSPTEAGRLASSIKESGDFTSTIADTKTGDMAALEGPYGRFSYLLHPDEGDLVFVAGGIGITPFRSMLRHMADTCSSGGVLLIYANRTEKDIAFREEFARMEEEGNPQLRVIHVLSEPDETWEGERGLVDEEKLGRFVGEGLAGKAYYVCAPAAMADGVIAALRKLGVNDSQIHNERFWFG